MKKPPITRNLILGVLLLLGLGLMAYGEYGDALRDRWRATRDEPAAPAVHYHAAFAVVVDGAPLDFSSPDQMHIAPCGTDEDPDAALSAKDRVHLHNQVGNVAHVHDDNVTWATLLESLAVPGLADKTWFVYKVSAAAMSDALPLETGITPYSQVIISDQPLSADALAAMPLPNRAEIEAIEAATLESCGTN
jgi:hypothetical protein